MSEVNQEVQEVQEVQKIQEEETPKVSKEVENQVNRPYKLKPDSRIELNAEELGFLISLGQTLSPFARLANGVTEIAAFGQYLADKVVKSNQVIFMDVPPAPSIPPPVIENTEEENKAKEELSKMRVVHNANNEQEELANQ